MEDEQLLILLGKVLLVSSSQEVLDGVLLERQSASNPSLMASCNIQPS
jgi:hypothetical protein